MNAEDFQPDRITVARDVLKNFIQGRPQDRVGLVIFSGKSYLQSPLTTDHNAVLNYLDQIHTGMIEDGTAIGMAIATCSPPPEAIRSQKSCHYSHDRWCQ